MKLEVHLLACDEERIAPYTLRHYTTIASRIVVHDAMSKDRTRAICADFGVEVKDFKTDGINDLLHKHLKETCWKGTDADWVIVADMDEIWYFPGGLFDTLSAYDSAGIAIVKPQGFEMFSEKFPNGPGQIYDEVKQGAPENEWYSKPNLFCPARIKSIEFSAGAHQAWGVLQDGTKWNDIKTPTEPPTFMLHCRHVCTLEEDAARYARQQARHSPTNKKNNFGNFEAPLKHAKDKRQKIMAGLRTIIP